MFDQNASSSLVFFIFPSHHSHIDRFKNKTRGFFTQLTRVVSDVVGAQGMGAGGSLVSQDTAPSISMMQLAPTEVAC